MTYDKPLLSFYLIFSGSSYFASCDLTTVTNTWRMCGWRNRWLKRQRKQGRLWRSSDAWRCNACSCPASFVPTPAPHCPHLYLNTYLMWVTRVRSMCVCVCANTREIVFTSTTQIYSKLVRESFFYWIRFDYSFFSFSKKVRFQLLLISAYKMQPHPVDQKFLKHMDRNLLIMWSIRDRRLLSNINTRADELRKITIHHVFYLPHQAT